MMQYVLVTGSREGVTYDDVARVLDRTWVKFVKGADVTLVHGGARGADRLAGEWAKAHGIAVEVHHAEWERYGKSAGHRRNRTMLNAHEYSLVVGFPRGEARGTMGMLRIAREAGYSPIIDDGKEA